MKLLFVSPIHPSPPRYGAQRRVHGLMTALAARHELHLLALGDPDLDRTAALEAARAYCSFAQLVPRGGGGPGKRAWQLRSLVSRHSFEWHLHAVPAMQRALDERLQAAPPDAIVLEFPFQSSLSFPHRGSGALLVLDEHNVEYDVLRQVAAGGDSRLRRLYNGLNWPKLRAEEEELWGRCDGISVTSADDAAVVRRARPDRPVAVVPNGVDVEHFRALPGVLPTPGTILFFGAIAYYPNTEGLLWFLRDCWPAIAGRDPRARLRIVGPRPPASILAFAGPRVEVTGFVEDLRREIAAAEVVVAPLLTGGGTRLKILEALAMARPVVSTALGAQGLEVKDGRELVLADDAEAFAFAVAGLLEDAPRREALGRAGRSLVESRYSWDAAALRLEELIGALRGPGSAGG